MKEKLAKIKSMAEEALESAKSAEALEELRIRFLGKKGELTSVMKGMGALSPEERPRIGQLANEVRDFIGSELEKQKTYVPNRENKTISVVTALYNTDKKFLADYIH